MKKYEVRKRVYVVADLVNYFLFMDSLIYCSSNMSLPFLSIVIEDCHERFH